ncbi:MAG: ABC transporter ATP-binding protein [Deltaproteobacteria bacterium]|jgi:ABC-2 type transport system ATP-binding protein|nr:ABC transporter ATP-binding protein [Deltaproteobacteria bacterium]
MSTDSPLKPLDKPINALSDNFGPVVKTRDLTKRYGRETVVSNLSLEVQAGEIFGFLGPNGAGKTTTLLMLLGLSEPSSGEAWVLGLNPVKAPLAVKSQVGYLPENMGFYQDLTAEENLKFVCELNNLKNAPLAETLSLVGLLENRNRLVSTYSRGMRQRLGLAEVLIKKPKLIFLDEPTLGLDPDGIATMLELIERLPREMGLTIILSSHLLHLVNKVANRVAILNKGRLLALGSVTDLAHQANLEPDLEKIYHYFFKADQQEGAA